MAKRKIPASKQVKHFKEVALEAECDIDEDAFKSAVKHIAKANLSKPPIKEPPQKSKKKR